MTGSTLIIEGLCASVRDKAILRGLDLTVRSGEVHAIMGPNGAGKSTLSHVLMGKSGYDITAGSVTLDGVDLLALAPHERAHAGLFLAMQYPTEVPGVSIEELLGEALVAAGRPSSNLRDRLEAEAARIEFDNRFLDRSLNVDFSGGEKKRNETLQLAVLQPKIAILDELDSGLDVDALRRQYALDMFGAAGDDMDTYGQTLEALWRQLDNVEEERKAAVSNQPRRSQHQVRTTAASQALIATLHALIAAAGARDLTPAQRERWTIIANGWRMSAYLFELGQRCEAGTERTALADEALAFWRTAIAPEDFAMYRDRVIGGVDVGSVPTMIGHLRGAWIP